MAAKPIPLNAGNVTRLPTARELDPVQTARSALDQVLAKVEKPKLPPKSPPVKKPKS